MITPIDPKSGPGTIEEDNEIDLKTPIKNLAAERRKGYGYGTLFVLSFVSSLYFWSHSTTVDIYMAIISTLMMFIGLWGLLMTGTSLFFRATITPVITESISKPIIRSFEKTGAVISSTIRDEHKKTRKLIVSKKK